jgi:hypothetical protein
VFATKVIVPEVWSSAGMSLSEMSLTSSFWVARIARFKEALCWVSEKDDTVSVSPRITALVLKILLTA